MADDKAFLTEDLALELQAWNRERRRTPPPSQGKSPFRDPGNRPPIVAILLDNLDSQGQADCAVLQKVTTPQIQKLELLGNLTLFLGGGAHFKLSFKGKKTKDLDFRISAADLQAALEAVETIGQGNVIVSLGTTPGAVGPPPEPGHQPGVWFIEFVGTFLDSTETIPLLVPTDLGGGVQNWLAVTEASVWEDTGLVETMNAVIPVGTPTPMRAGAQAVGIFFPGVGFGCIACEAREYFATPYYY